MVMHAMQSVCGVCLSALLSASASASFNIWLTDAFCLLLLVRLGLVRFALLCVFFSFVCSSLLCCPLICSALLSSALLCVVCGRILLYLSIYLSICLATLVLRRSIICCVAVCSLTRSVLSN
jgi:hypothetical protein